MRQTQLIFLSPRDIYAPQQMPHDSQHVPAHTARQPIIILGMHRSGTSLVTELLESLGLFVGRDLEDNHESQFFIDLSNQLLTRIGGSWDHPNPFRDFLLCPDAVHMSTLAMGAELASKRFKRFSGSGSLQQLDQPWGWKDPRSVVTLPLFLKLFPAAKIIYVLRHGIDVASSLMVREQQLLKKRSARFEARLRKFGFRSLLDRAGYKGSARCLTLAGAFDLWLDYVQHADTNLQSLSNPQIVIRYEDLLKDPKKHLAELAQFCELNASIEKVAKASEQIKSSRSLAFKNDPEAAAFYDSVKTNPWLLKSDY